MAGVLLVALVIAAPSPVAAQARSTPTEKCRADAEFPGTPSQFDVDHTDEFGRAGRLRGREYLPSSKRVYLRLSCFTANDAKPLTLDREKAIQAFYEYTRTLGMFGQKYFFRQYPDRAYLTITGSRRIEGQEYLVRIEQHFFPHMTVSLVSSNRQGDGGALDMVTAFFESFRVARLGS